MNSRLLSFALLSTFASALGCDDASGGGGGAGGTGSSTSTGSAAHAPTVVSNAPSNGATDVAMNGNATVTFSEPMDCGSLSKETFSVRSGASPVDGTVLCSGSQAVFWPSAHLPSNAMFTATIGTGAKSLAHVALEAEHVWTFTTGDLLAPGLPVDLGTASNFVILAKAAVSSVPTSAIVGDVGVSPSAASFITGFSLTADATNAFSTSTQVMGKVYAADFAAPTPAMLTTAVGDMQLAFTDAAARAPDVTELGAGSIGGLTLAPGVYKWGTGLLIPTSLTLDGDGDDVWIFQIAQDLTVSSAAQITLAGGARPENVFWQVAGLVDIDTTAHVAGIILTQTAITMHTGASIEGRLFAQTAVSLDENAVTQPTK